MQILITEAATALRGREPELRKILAELGELTDTATPLAGALDERRRLLASSSTTSTSSSPRSASAASQLAETIDAGSRDARR